MLQLRDQLFATLAPWVLPIFGWHPANPWGPCKWAGVECDQQRHITKLCVGAGRGGGTAGWRVSQPRWAACTRRGRPPPRAAPRPPCSRPCPCPARSRLRNDDLKAAAAVAARKWYAHKLPTLSGGLADAARLSALVAALPHLEELVLVQHFAPWDDGVPPEWLAPGALPKLKRCAVAPVAALRHLWLRCGTCGCAPQPVPPHPLASAPLACPAAEPAAPARPRRLVLGGICLGGPLPQLRPGQLPALESLELRFEEGPAALPPSWGASPATLPALRSLTVAMPLAAPLPERWAAGFARLTQLTLAGPGWLVTNRSRMQRLYLRQQAGGGTDDPWPAAGGGDAPEGGEQQPWAAPGHGNAARHAQPAPNATDVPKEEAAAGAALQLDAPLPASWASGLPQLTRLHIAGLGLTGGIPAAWSEPGSWPQLQLL